MIVRRALTEKALSEELSPPPVGVHRVAMVLWNEEGSAGLL